MIFLKSLTDGSIRLLIRFLNFGCSFDLPGRELGHVLLHCLHKLGSRRCFLFGWVPDVVVPMPVEVPLCLSGHMGQDAVVILCSFLSGLDTINFMVWMIHCMSLTDCHETSVWAVMSQFTVCLGLLQCWCLG